MASAEDDIFDESASDILIGSKEWTKMERGLTKLGYRDGMAEGQEVKVQEGFDQGYKSAASLVFRIASLRGEISALLSLKHLQKTLMDKSTETSLEKLIQDVQELEETFMKTPTTECEADQSIDQQNAQVTKEVTGDSKKCCGSCDCQDSKNDTDKQESHVTSQCISLTINKHSTEVKLAELQGHLKVILESSNTT